MAKYFAMFSNAVEDGNGNYLFINLSAVDDDQSNPDLSFSFVHEDQNDHCNYDQAWIELGLPQDFKEIWINPLNNQFTIIPKDPITYRTIDDGSIVCQIPSDVNAYLSDNENFALTLISNIDSSSVISNGLHVHTFGDYKMFEVIYSYNTKIIVAIHDPNNEVAGYVIYTEMMKASQVQYRALTVGAIAPSYQGNGIPSQLVPLCSSNNIPVISDFRGHNAAGYAIIDGFKLKNSIYTDVLGNNFRIFGDINFELDSQPQYQ